MFGDEDYDNELFCGMVDRRTALRLFHSRDHCRGSQQSRQYLLLKIHCTKNETFHEGKDFFSKLTNSSEN